MNTNINRIEPISQDNLGEIQQEEEEDKEWNEEILKHTVRDKASIEKAISHYNKTSIRSLNGDKYPVCKTNNLKLGRYGLGLLLYFDTLQKITIFFGLVSLLEISRLVLFYQGDMASNTNLLALFTMGNSNTKNNPNADQQEQNKLIQDVKQFQLLVLIIDFSIQLLLMSFIVMLNRRAIKLKERFRQQFSQVSDFSVVVKNLPKGITKQEVKEFFQSKFGEVVEVSFARKYEGFLTLFKNRQKFRIIKGRQQLKMLTNNLQNDPQEIAKLKLIQLEIFNYDRMIQSSGFKIQRHSDLEVHEVYIIFQNQKDKVKCILEYTKYPL